jgi:glyoxylate/hydroxypyruvate reductase
MALLYHSGAERGAIWARVFAEHAPWIEMIEGETAVTDPGAVTHLACWTLPDDLSRYPNLRVILSVGAGVDQFRAEDLPPGVAVVRTVAPGIEEMVRDWVVMATLMLHRDMPRYLAQAAQGQWQGHPTRAAQSRRIGVMGMGRIGRKVAQTLSEMGFPVQGWSRSGQSDGVIPVYDTAGLPAFLAGSDILICLLPLTGATRGLLNEALFDALPAGAALVHAGRGPQLDMPALTRALDRGQLSAAMLDVTDPEPLPQDHPFWADPRILVTPHVASETDPVEGALHVIAVLKAEAEGRTLPGLVDPRRGY